MKLLKKVNSLCPPAYFYLVISVVAMLLMIGQNLYNGNMNELCVGAYSCNVSNVAMLLVVKVLYVAFWTVVLDAFCKYGLKKLSWLLVLFPLVMFAIGLGLMMVDSNAYLLN